MTEKQQDGKICISMTMFMSSHPEQVEVERMFEQSHLGLLSPEVRYATLSAQAGVIYEEIADFYRTAMEPVEFNNLVHAVVELNDENWSDFYDPDVPTVAVDHLDSMFGLGLVGVEAARAREDGSLMGMNIVFLPDYSPRLDVAEFSDGSRRASVREGILIAADGRVGFGLFPAPVVADAVESVREPTNELRRFGVPMLSALEDAQSVVKKSSVRLQESEVRSPRHVELLPGSSRRGTRRAVRKAYGAHGVVVKPDGGRRGQNVRLFGPDQHKAAVAHAEGLLRRGENVVVEERIRSLPLDAKEDLDWNTRTIIVFGKVVGLYVRAGLYGGPVNIALGASRESVEATVDKLANQNGSLPLDYYTKLIQAGEALGRLLPNSMIGADTTIGDDGEAYVYELNIGNAGGLTNVGIRQDGSRSTFALEAVLEQLHARILPRPAGEPTVQPFKRSDLHGVTMSAVRAFRAVENSPLITQELTTGLVDAYANSGGNDFFLRGSLYLALAKRTDFGGQSMATAMAMANELLDAYPGSEDALNVAYEIALRRCNARFVQSVLARGAKCFPDSESVKANIIIYALQELGSLGFFMKYDELKQGLSDAKRSDVVRHAITYLYPGFAGGVEAGQHGVFMEVVMRYAKEGMWEMLEDYIRESVALDGEDSELDVLYLTADLAMYYRAWSEALRIAQLLKKQDKELDVMLDSFCTSVVYEGMGDDPDAMELCKLMWVEGQQIYTCFRVLEISLFTKRSLFTAAAETIIHNFLGLESLVPSQQETRRLAIDIIEGRVDAVVDRLCLALVQKSQVSGAADDTSRNVSTGVTLAVYAAAIRRDDKVVARDCLAKLQDELDDTVVASFVEQVGDLEPRVDPGGRVSLLQSMIESLEDITGLITAQNENQPNRKP